jgi:hypothetical protein
MPFLVAREKLRKEQEEKVRQLLEQQRVHEFQRQQQQGLGRPIISVEHEGYRFVAVGGRLYYSNTWKTFIDFLGDYLRTVFGSDWGDEEFKKPLEERHPLIKWHQRVALLQQRYLQKTGEIYSMPITGAVAAYFGLAYNLYLIAHNGHDIETRLIARLKNKDNFQGAYYETRVAAELVKAGFELEYENETDNSTTHCEFIATSSRTKRRFSVEAKSRAIASDIPRGKLLRVGSQLYSALKKQAKFTRVVFIDINRPIGLTQDEAAKVLDHAVAIIKRSESMRISGQPAPPAYICLTNYPDQYQLDVSQNLGVVQFLGYKIHDFMDAKFASIREAIRARERHMELFDLRNSIRDFRSLPITFDGTLLSDSGKVPRLIIGQRYTVPDQDGNHLEGVLFDAVVNEPEKRAYGIYKLDTGVQIVATVPLTDEELHDYSRNPNTFFGVFKKQHGSTNSPIELFDFFFETYKDTPRERLLEFIKDAPDFENFQSLSQKDLAEAICERWVYNTMRNRV